MIASLGKEDQSGDIEQIFHEKQTQFKKKNIFVLNDILQKDPGEKLEKNEHGRKGEKVDRFAINADEISSMSSVDSDNELWDSIETKRLKSIGYPRSQTKGEKSETTSVISGGMLQKKRESKMIPIEIGSQIGQETSEITTDHKVIAEKYEKKMDKMRENHRLEIHTISNSIQNKAKEMVTAKVEELKLKFEADIRNLMQQYVRAKTELEDKDSQITSLNDLIRQQERALNGYRRQAEKGQLGEGDQRMTSAGEYLHQTEDDDIHPMALRNQIANLEAEVASLRNICNVYKRDEEKKDQELIKTRKELKESEHKHQFQIDLLTGEYEEKLSIAKQEYRDLENQFNKYKANVELEMKILQSLVDRNKTDAENMKIQILAQRRTHDRLSVTHGGKQPGIKKEASRSSNRGSSANTTKQSRKSVKTRKDSEGSEKEDHSGELPQIPESRGSTKLGGSRTSYAPPSRDVKRRKHPGESDQSFYSHDRDRSSIITPGSTKYGSFATRPNTAFEKNKANSSFGFTDGGGENFNPNNNSML